MKEFGGGFFLRGPFSFKISVHTCKCTHTHQLKQIQEVCPHFVNSLGLFFFLKVVPRVRMSHWPHNGATVTARPPLSSDSRRMPLWEGFWVALYSLHAEVLTPCVGPLTPHLLSPLMWLYWLWHTEHGDDDQTIKSPPPPSKGRAITVTNHSTGLLCCPSVCVWRARVVCACPQNVTIRKRWWTKSGGWNSSHPHHHLTPPPSDEYETEFSGFLTPAEATHTANPSLIMVKLSAERKRSGGSYDRAALLLADNCNSTLNSLNQPFQSVLS